MDYKTHKGKEGQRTTYISGAKSKAVKKAKGEKSWAETHGQEPGKQLKGTITGRKFGPKSYPK